MLQHPDHAHARSPKFSMRRWEFDPSWPLIRMLAAARLIAVLRPPVRLPEPGA